MTAVEVAIVGGGFAGLLAASALRQAGVDDLLVLECSDQPGGCARTMRAGSYALEPGAGSFSLPHPALGMAFDKAGSCVEPAHSRRRYLHDGARLHEVTSPSQALSRLSVAGRLRLLAEPLRRRSPEAGDESLTSFLTRRLGQNAGRLASDLMAAGVFAGDGDQLSVGAAFPMLAQLEARHGSLARGMMAAQRARPPDLSRPRPHIPCAGMDALADSLAAPLQGSFRSAFPVVSVQRTGAGWEVEGPELVRARHLVLALPAGDAAAIVGGEPARLLEQAATAPVVVAAFSSAADQFPLPDGFGALTVGGGATLGILFESSYAPARSPGGRSLVKVIAGGARHPEVADRTDEELKDLLSEDLNHLLGWSSPHLEILARRSIPQYPLGHRAWLAELESVIGENLHLAGWSYRGPGLAQLAVDGRRIAGLITA